ncbi:MAG: hypothetical protein ABH834_02160 [Candidatus Altiarchaeota archaeon]
MKEKLQRQLGQAKRTYWFTRIYGWMILYLAAIIGFTLLFQLIGVKTWYAIIPATLYIELLVIIKLLFKPKIIDQLEHRNPSLDGSLLTAYENQGRSNIIVDDLMVSVSGKLDGVGYSTFVDMEDLTYRTLTTIILAFIFLTVTVVSYQDMILNMDWRQTALAKAGREIRMQGERLFGGGIWESSEDYGTEEEEDQLGASAGGREPGFSEGPISGDGTGVGGDAELDIYGEPGSANLWGQDVSMEMHPEYGGDIDVSEGVKEFAPEQYVMPDVESGQDYKDYPVEQEELVRTYFEKLLEGS